MQVPACWLLIRFLQVLQSKKKWGGAGNSSRDKVVLGSRRYLIVLAMHGRGCLQYISLVRYISNYLVQIDWSKAQSTLELSLAKFSPSLFKLFPHLTALYYGKFPCYQPLIFEILEIFKILEIFEILEILGREAWVCWRVAWTRGRWCWCSCWVARAGGSGRVG